MPATNPPTCAQNAMPPASAVATPERADAADELHQTNHKPSKKMAGTSMICQKMKIGSSVRTREWGKQHEIGADHARDRAARPDHRHGEAGGDERLDERSAARRRADRRRMKRPWPSRSSTLSPKIQR